MSRAENVVLMNMCMLYVEENVLVIDKVDPEWAGITFPGGHVEKGESFTDSVIREFYEETGLTIISPMLCGIKDWTDDDGTRYMILLYEANEYKGTLTSSDEGNVFWMEIDEMGYEKLAPGMEKTLEVFINRRNSEDFFYKKDGKWVEVIK